MKIAIDGMGGDRAPEAIASGALRALEAFPDLEILAFGDRDALEPLLGGRDRLTVIHAAEVIEGTDEPVRAIRRKKDSSMVRMAQAVASGEAAACVSAGNTGALMAAGLFLVGRLPGVERPALASVLPTLDDKGFTLLDMGANADAKPEHLLQYAIMGNVFAEKVRGIASPRIGLLNIGTEPGKGNELAKQAYSLLERADLRFVGNVEARDLLQGVADVVVTDGFTGNMVLKTLEGTASGIFAMLKDAFLSSGKGKMAALLMKDKLQEMKGRMDYSEYGGAPLFGLKGPVIKAHGSSNDTAFFHAIRQARQMAASDATGVIRAALQGGPSDA